MSSERSAAQSKDCGSLKCTFTGQRPYLRLRLPATSANLGPGFDALGLAMALYLTIDATVADGPSTSTPPGATPTLRRARKQSHPHHLHRRAGERRQFSRRAFTCGLQNEIPLGMGCGSSAAALLAGVLLANHFGDLDWTNQQILEEACRREGHPDNVAACYLGGMTVSSPTKDGIVTATCGQNLTWSLVFALPSASLSTTKARALLPAHYSREDAVANIQATALLVAAFAQGRGDLLRTAMRDRIHQPYRMAACPLLRPLLPLMEKSENHGILRRSSQRCRPLRPADCG